MPRSIFITGVSSGIGHALAKQYLGQGDTVFGISRRLPEDLLTLPGFEFRSVNLSRPEQIAAEIERFLPVAKLDLLILNAAVIGEIRDMIEIPLAELTELMQVNVWANKVILDTFFALGNSVTQVVAISSGAAVQASRGWGGYAISKAALNMLIGLYATERPETHFSVIAPGLVDTAMQESLASLPDDPRFPAIKILKALRGTARMPKPEQAAQQLLQAFAKAPRHPSGSFLDLEQLK